jgi:hypothetical protein
MCCWCSTTTSYARARQPRRIGHATMKQQIATLSMWSVYRCPLDYPSHWVARRFLIGGGRPDPEPTKDMFIAHSLDEVHKLLPPGMVLIPRSPGDHPTLIESWIDLGAPTCSGCW